MSVIHEENRNRVDARVLVAPLAVLAGMGVLASRLWYLQYAGAESIAEEASRTTTLLVQHPAPRGIIVDRKGETLAGVQGQLVVTAIPKLALKDEASMAQIAKLLKSDVDTVKEKLESNAGSYLPLPISENVSIEAATKIAELLSTVPDAKPGKESGLAAYDVQNFPMRVYGNAFEFAHVLGYVKSADGKDIERINTKLKEANDNNRRPGEFVGKRGLERANELSLMGYPSSEEYITDHRRKPLMVQSSSQAVPGDKLTLTIDAGLQRYAYQQLGNYTGAVVALDPKNGEVLCMVSKPSYDVQMLMGRMTPEEYKTLSDPIAKPELNRAIANHQPPGSTFKIVTTLAAWMAGVDPFKVSYYCDGWIKVSAHDTPKKCLGHHGNVMFNRAMAQSCNSFFGKLGMSLKRTDLEKACNTIGLGEPTGLDIGGEVRGAIPDKAQADLILKRDKRRYSVGDQLNSAIGQGVVRTTPVQMANVIAFVANRGRSYAPHLVRARAPYGEKPIAVQPVLAHEFKASDYFWNNLIGGLESVVNAGTARRSLIPGVRMGGKTGSAEVWLPNIDANGKVLKGAHKEEGKTHSWFIAFAPIDNPKIAICVMAERAGHGSDVAAPIASSIVRHYLESLNAPAKKPGSTGPVAPDIQVSP